MSNPPETLDPAVILSKEPLPTDFKVYKPVRYATDLPDQPDSVYTPTTADLITTQAHLAARAQTVKTVPGRSQLEARDKAKQVRWPDARIRIKFTDGTQLEKVFPSSNKIKSIYAFVRGSLREDVKPIKFILSEPPNRDLKVSDLKVRDLTLAQLNLVPSSILILRFEDDSLNHECVPAPLIPDILTQAVEVSPPPPPIDAGQETISKEIVAPPSDKGKIKVPKWMKVGLKK